MDNSDILQILSREVNIPLKRVENTIRLKNDGGTVPFISRYRKEETGGLNEVEILNIFEKYDNLCDLLKRKEYVLKTIEESGHLTSALEEQISGCWNETELEDLYLPYKPKRKTRADSARNKGLEPLAKIIMSQKTDDITYIAQRYVSDEVLDISDAVQGAKDIIAEWISENVYVRSIVRKQYTQTAIIKCKLIKGKDVGGVKFTNYFNVSELLKKCASHRLLAMLRGEKEGILKIKLEIDESECINKISRYFVKKVGESSKCVEGAVEDSFKRLIKPSIEAEVLTTSKQNADKIAINTFARNLRQLLLVAPLGKKRVLSIDPGFRTGCKVVCLDEQGALLYDDIIYPTAPRNDIEGATSKIKLLIKKYNIDVIAVGNGTASRETEQFLRTANFGKEIEVYVVNESGASIYSASKVARDEFPDKDVTVRGAVSIGRRLLDPLAELVKIDPKSIGVGQYQHDVDQTKLKDSLVFTVESCVNSVGVNVNTASKELLMYVSGLGIQLAQNIVDYRNVNGAFKSRQELMCVPRFGAKAFQQASAFLRIPDGVNPLDNSAVHPERYRLVEQMAEDLNCSVGQLINDEDTRKKIDIDKYISGIVGKPTLEDIMIELEKPGRDPRGEYEILKFDDNIKVIEDLKEGMMLLGVVTNVTQFGVFVDIGLHENGLVHISELCNRFISDPSEVVCIIIILDSNGLGNFRQLRLHLISNGCAKLSVNSLLSLLNALCENGQGLKCKIGTTNLGKLTDAQKAIATDKGWELL